MKNRALNFLLVSVLIAFLSACTGQQTRAKSSVVDYLYPKSANTLIAPSVPTLNLPLKVGIAFVPDQQIQHRGHNPWTGRISGGSTLSETTKSRLLEKVAANFRELAFVSDIQVIPSDYLTPEGGFSNLQQIQTMYGIDVIALVSYDQVQFTDEGFLSLTYWTIVGAYVVSGEKNDTSTMLDTVVYDIKSKKMLFRAPGTSIVKGSSTPVNLSEELRKDSIKGFEAAAEKMTTNLDLQLTLFRDKLKREPEQVKIVHRSGYSGGALNPFEMAFLFVLISVLVSTRKRTN